MKASPVRSEAARDRQRGPLELVGGSAQDAHGRLVAFAERGLHATGQRANRRRLEMMMINLMQQQLRLRHLKMVEQHLREHGARPPEIRGTKHRAQRRPADPVAAALVAEHIPPAA